MKSMKLLAVSATVIASISVAGVSLADDKNPHNTQSPGTTSAPVTTTGTGTSQSTGSTTTVTTPSSPPTTATQTTQTTLDANGSATTTPPATTTTPTSTTTVTQAEIAPPPAAPRESDTVVVERSKRPNTALLVTGGALLVSSYVTTAAVHAANGRPGDVDDHLYIPVAGPWINLGQSSHETRDDVLIVGSGILQGAGAALFISSFFIPEKVEAARITAGPVKLNLTPTSYRGGAGFGAVGTF